jgi:hypothetical protein
LCWCLVLSLIVLVWTCIKKTSEGFCISMLCWIAFTAWNTWWGDPGFLQNKLSFLYFHRHHMNVSIFSSEAWGWFMVNSFVKIWVREVHLFAIISDLMNQGYVNMSWVLTCPCSRGNSPS